jgi:hypothetical protein
MKHYDVAAYIWPSYHYEPRVAHFWPEKDGEWYTVRRGTPRFPGHDMPRIPLLGCQDEADPEVMRQHVGMALEHGINVFVVDWYWYENAPCFERQLNEGLIPALEGTGAKVCLMWANHDLDNILDMHADTSPKEIYWSGKVSREILEPMFGRIVRKYFSLDCYYRINGRPVFSIFDVPNLTAGLGGAGQTADALEWMRRHCVESGLAGLEIQAITRQQAGAAVDGGGIGAPEIQAATRQDDGIGAALESAGKESAMHNLGFDSATSYQYRMDSFPTGDYVVWADHAIGRWPEHEALYGTYYPHVSVGWDNTPRNPSYAQENVVLNSTPHAFEACLWKARAWLDARPGQAPLVTINSWNEWTEGSCLLPDMRWGYDYLRAVRNVFGQA